MADNKIIYNSCACSSNEHIQVYRYFLPDKLNDNKSTLYLSVYLNQIEHWYKRIWFGILYMFNIAPDYGYWDTHHEYLNNNDNNSLKDVINLLKDFINSSPNLSSSYKEMLNNYKKYAGYIQKINKKEEEEICGYVLIENDEHIIQYILFKDLNFEPCLVSAVYLKPRERLYSKFWVALKYVFGYKCRYGSWDEFEIHPEEARALLDIRSEL